MSTPGPPSDPPSGSQSRPRPDSRSEAEPRPALQSDPLSGAHARALAALGHDARLAIFRLLVRAGDDGLRVGEIGGHLGLAPSTLAHHLAALVAAGLVTQERQGREVVNRVDYPAMHRLLAFLTSECCAGVALRNTEEAA